MIDFSHKNTRNIAISLYKRMTENNYKYQTLTLFTGFGKTAISVATAGLFAVRFKQDINVFIVAPRTKLDDGSWEYTINEYNKIAKYKLNILDKSTPQGLDIANKNDRLLKRDIKAMPEKKRNKLKFLKEWKEATNETPTVFLIDEVQMFKNPTTNRSKALKKLMTNGIGLGITATPMSNGLLEDGVSYLIFNGFYDSKNQFEKQHIPRGMYDEYYKPDVYTKDHEIDPNRFIDLPLFEDRIKQTVYAPEIPVDFEMPNTETHTVSYDLAPQTIYNMKKIHLDYKQRRYDSYMGYLSDLRRAIGGDLNHARQLAKIILANPGRQPLIFYNTNAELEAIQYALQQIHVDYKTINGHPDSDKVQDIDHSFKNQAIIIQYKAGGAGIEFKNSSLTIFYGLQYSWQDTEQAMGRNVRRGMSSDLTVDHLFLVATNPHDARVFESLERKETFTDNLLSTIAEEVMKESL